MTVAVFGPSATEQSRDRIESLAEYNEVGIYNPAYYDAGEYTSEYTYVVNPPLEYDATTTHLNLKLAGTTHIPYHNVRVTLPAKGIDQVYVYPPLMHTEKTGDSYVITGDLAADEILCRRDARALRRVQTVPGFPDCGG